MTIFERKLTAALSEMAWNGRTRWTPERVRQQSGRSVGPVSQFKSRPMRGDLDDPEDVSNPAGFQAAFTDVNKATYLAKATEVAQLLAGRLEMGLSELGTSPNGPEKWLLYALLVDAAKVPGHIAKYLLRSSDIGEKKLGRIRRLSIYQELLPQVTPLEGLKSSKHPHSLLRP